MIHDEHPFLPPESERSPVRRFRGRLAAPVTLWTAALGQPASTGPASTGPASVEPASTGPADPKHIRRDWAGLPVSSVVVAEGEPALVGGLVDADSDLWAVLEPAGRFVVSILSWEHRALADAFAGLAPAPGGPFRLTSWDETAWGPRPGTVGTWAGCAVRDVRSLGWGLLVTGELETVVLDGAAAPTEALLRYRGRYRHLG